MSLIAAESGAAGFGGGGLPAPATPTPATPPSGTMSNPTPYRSPAPVAYSPSPVPVSYSSPAPVAYSPSPTPVSSTAVASTMYTQPGPIMYNSPTSSTAMYSTPVKPVNTTPVSDFGTPAGPSPRPARSATPLSPLPRARPTVLTPILPSITTTSTTPSVQPSTILGVVQEHLLGRRNVPLTPQEVAALFAAPITLEFNLLLLRGLQRVVTGSIVLDPQLALIQALTNAYNEEYLIPVALCLRYGADPNIYVNMPNVGVVHLLGYMYITLDDNGLSSLMAGKRQADPITINTLAALLVAKGARASMPMFESIDPNNPRIMSSAPVSVREWLSEQGYVTVLDQIDVGSYTDLVNSLGVDKATKISIVLDLPQMKGREYVDTDLNLAIRSHSLVAINQIPIPTTRKWMDNAAMILTVDNLNADAFERLVQAGYMPSYILLNHMITSMKHYQSKGDTIAIVELERILKYSISTGAQLDQAQYDLVSTLGGPILSSINNSYDRPYWNKICSSPTSDLPPALQRLAISLGVDPGLTKAGVCTELNRMSQTDRGQLIQAARQRQQERLNANLGSPSQFINGNMANLSCQYGELLAHDPMSYNDMDLASYKSDDGNIYCFTSDQFGDLLDSKRNRYTQEPLPPAFLIMLRGKMDTLRLLGLTGPVYATRVPETFDQALTKLDSKDSVGSRNSDLTVEKFLLLGADAGVNSKILTSATKDQLLAALNTVGYTISFDFLSASHALITTAYIVNQLSTQMQGAFFDSLGAGSYRPAPLFVDVQNTQGGTVALGLPVYAARN